MRDRGFPILGKSTFDRFRFREREFSTPVVLIVLMDTLNGKGESRITLIKDMRSFKGNGDIARGDQKSPMGEKTVCPSYVLNPRLTHLLKWERNILKTRKITEP